MKDLTPHNSELSMEYFCAIYEDEENIEIK